MATFQKIVFTDLCINGRLITLGDVNECTTGRLQGRHCLTFALCENDIMEIDIEESLAEFSFSKWVPESVARPIFDFRISTSSIPPWMETYSTATAGCVHRIIATMKVCATQTNYVDFLNRIRSAISTTQHKNLENDEALDLWNKRCTPPSSRVVSGVRFLDSQFGYFSLVDLERLRNDERWLSDSHVCFALQDCFRDSSDRKVWGDLNILLLDTTFWERLSSNPEKYREGQRRKVNLLESDYVVMPMFGANHWRLGIVEKPGEFIKGNTVLHILDSLRQNSLAAKEANQLQNILLKHFKGEKFKPGRISTNVPQVPRQSNSKDCGCFTIYFAKKFFLNPTATMGLIKNPPSTGDGAAEWGLKSNDLTFIRRELGTLLYKYIRQGDAIVEFKKS